MTFSFVGYSLLRGPKHSQYTTATSRGLVSRSIVHTRNKVQALETVDPKGDRDGKLSWSGTPGANTYVTWKLRLDIFLGGRRRHAILDINTTSRVAYMPSTSCPYPASDVTLLAYIIGKRVGVGEPCFCCFPEPGIGCVGLVCSGRISTGGTS